MIKTSSFGISAALFGTILGFYLLFSPAHFLTSPDEELNLRTTLSFWQGHGGAIPSLEGFASKTGKNGREYAQYGLGLPWAALPWCALGVAIDPTPNSLEANTLALYFDNSLPAASVGTNFLRGWMTVFTMMVTALTVTLVHAILRRLSVSASNAVFVSLLLGLGCICWPHGRTFFTEPVAAFCLIAAVGCLLNARQGVRPWLWVLGAGVFWSYAVLTRLDSLITLPATIWLLVTAPQSPPIRFRIAWKEWIIFSLPWLVVFSIILLYNLYRFGSFVSTGYEDQPEKIRFLTPLLVGLHGFLFTPGRSVFLYSPPLIFAIAGIVPLWKRNPWLAGGILGITAAYLITMSKWQNWAGGYDWGPRHIYQITPFLAILLGVWLGDRRWFDRPAKRIGWAVLAIVSVSIQFLGLSADSVFTIKWFLSRSLQPFPPQSAELAMPYLLQMPVYLPQFSTLSLHWQWITGHGPNLLIRVCAIDNPAALLYFLLPGLMAVCGIGFLIRNLKRETLKNRLLGR